MFVFRTLYLCAIQDGSLAGRSPEMGRKKVGKLAKGRWFQIHATKNSPPNPLRCRIAPPGRQNGIAALKAGLRFRGVEDESSPHRAANHGPRRGSLLATPRSNRTRPGSRM